MVSIQNSAIIKLNITALKNARERRIRRLLRVITPIQKIAPFWGTLETNI